MGLGELVASPSSAALATAATEEGVLMPMFNAVVRLEIEEDRGLNSDDLELILRGTIEAPNAAEAMVKLGRSCYSRVEEKLTQ